MASSAQTDDIDAAIREAFALQSAGNAAGAAERYETLRAKVPHHPDLLYLLGTAYVQLGRPRDGLPLLETSLAGRPAHGPTLEMLGSAWHRVGEAAKSLPYFSQAVACLPQAPDTWFNYGNALLECARHEEAATAFRHALSLTPHHAKAATGLGLALAGIKKFAEAESVLRECLRHTPSHLQAYVGLGNLLGQQERFLEAEKVFGAGLELAPHDVSLRRLLGGSLHRQGRLAEAVTAYRSALDITPLDETLLIQVADALTALGRLDEAEAYLRAAIAEKPASAGALTGMGHILELRGALDDAMKLHDRAVAADPFHENAYINRGNTRRFSGDFDGALADYSAALALKTGKPAAAANRGLTLLTLGRLREGWPDFKMRLRAVAGAPNFTAGKPWDGGSLGGKNVLAWMEYGLGDEIMFASLLPEVIAQTKHCTVACSARLLSLFRRSFPAATFIPLGPEVAGDFDVRVPLTDIAQVLRPSLDAFQRHNGYLKSDPTMRDKLRRRYDSAGKRIVGISWRSGAGTTGPFKSAALSDWAPILQTPGTTFVSLQYGDSTVELDAVRASTGATIIADPEIDSSGGMDSFAAQVDAMDLIVTISNTTAHVAGALGKPTWLLVPKGPGAHWYWFLNRSDSPWYPSVRIFRQDQRGDWNPVLAQVAHELTAWHGGAA